MTAPPETWIVLPGLGRFRSRASSWTIDPREFRRSILETVERLNDGPGVHAAAHQALADYEADPSEANRRRVVRMYEAVPPGEREFLGAPGTGDGRFREVVGEGGNDL